MFITFQRLAANVCGDMADESSTERYTRLMVRISDQLRGKLQASAAQGGRSLSAEMLLRIERSFEADDELEELRAMIDDHEARIKELEKDVYRALDNAGLLTDYR